MNLNTIHYQLNKLIITIVEKYATMYYGLVKVEDVNTIIEEHLIGGKVVETKTLEYLKANK